MKKQIGHCKNCKKKTPLLKNKSKYALYCSTECTNKYHRELLKERKYRLINQEYIQKELQGQSLVRINEEVFQEAIIVGKGSRIELDGRKADMKYMRLKEGDAIRVTIEILHRNNR